MSKTLDWKEDNLEKPLKRFVHSITYGNLWPYILNLVSKKEVYAYTLPDLIQTEFGFKPNKIMLYVVLYKLESDGYIKGRFKDRRKYYKITAKGKRILKNLRTELNKFINVLF